MIGEQNQEACYLLQFYLILLILLSLGRSTALHIVSRGSSSKSNDNKIVYN